MLERAKHALQILRINQARLKELGIVSAGVFGSQVRGDATPQSDIDVVIFIDCRKLTIFDLVGIEREVGELVTGPVDVVAADQLKPVIRERVLAEAEYAF